MTTLLTTQEEECLSALVDAWDKFIALPELNPVDSHEFMHAIHAAESIILARPYLRFAKQKAYTDAPSPLDNP